MTDTFVTVHGWLGNDVQVRQAGDAQVASFRLASTPRRFHRRTGAWVDGPTQWYTVDAWRSLGENCRDSLRRGDPVVVHGRLEARTWVNSSGVEVTTMVLEAASVGHDLARGVSRFRKNVRAEDPDAVAGASTGSADDTRTTAATGPQDASAGEEAPAA